MEIRKLSGDEEGLLELLISKASIGIAPDWKDNLLASNMDNGGSGSLYLYPQNIAPGEREFGMEISEYEFKDSDGVEVVATLNVDENNNLYELDIWKANFGKLISYPKPTSK